MPVFQESPLVVYATIEARKFLARDRVRFGGHKLDLAADLLDVPEILSHVAALLLVPMPNTLNYHAIDHTRGILPRIVRSEFE